MKIYTKLAMLFLCAALFLCACTESTVIDPHDYGDLPSPGVDGLVWEQLWGDWLDIYSDSSVYPFSETVRAGIDQETEIAEFYLILKPDADLSRRELVAYAMEAVQGFGALINEQDSGYEKPSETSFGGYLKDYEIHVYVGTNAALNGEEEWMLFPRENSASLK